MRIPIKTSGPLSVRAIAGTKVVLMAFDVAEAQRTGLHGFAVKRGKKGQPAQWLKGLKYFQALVPDPKRGDLYSTDQHPIQGFVWSDYIADPGTTYSFSVVAMYGDIHHLESRYSLDFEVTTELEIDKGHGVWFNRGAIASHALATQFRNKPVTKEMFNAVSDTGQITDPEVAWLSRGLGEALFKFINDLKAGEALRVSAYEFTYAPILSALKRALLRGVDVQIVYHLTPSNTKAVEASGLTKTHEGKQVLFPRTHVAIPHNKFMVKIVGGKATQVITGSTNFTDTGFYGQTNVAHLVINNETANKYWQYWKELSEDPLHAAAVTNAVALTPNPQNAIPKSSIAEFYSPRIADNMLDWYADRIDDASSLAVMTIPFNVANAILAGLAKAETSLRLVILEDPPTKEVTQAEIQNKGMLAFSNGAILGKTFIKYKSQAGGAKVVPITTTPLEKWFVDEELDRPTNQGHVFFVHAKFLLVDPLLDDPLVCSGSANFSSNSLTANDENMLLIRGDTRVADIYITEFDRIFRHFYARDAINQFAQKGSQVNPLILDTTDGWLASNFKPGSYKNNRRLMFFPPGGAAPGAWSAKAETDRNPFDDEAARAAAVRAKKNAAAKARRAAGSSKAAKGKAAVKSKAKTRAKTKAKSAPKKRASKAKSKPAKSKGKSMSSKAKSKKPKQRAAKKK